MSLLFIFENKDAQPWANALKAKLGNVKIEIYPDVENNDDVEFIICWKPQRDVLLQFPNVKFIQSAGAAIDHIINTQTLRSNVMVTRFIDKELSHDMWEFLLSVVMAQMKNATAYLHQQQSSEWKQHQYKTINNTTIAILGLGEIGGYVARQFAQLNFRVKGWSLSRKVMTDVESYCGENELAACLSNADVLINLLPRTPKTENILNKRTLQMLPNSAYLINVGRGEHLVESDLIELLNSNQLSGALLDVFREEPLPQDHIFWKHPHIQVTPHIASLTNCNRAINQFIVNYNKTMNNEELINVASINKGY